MLGRLDVAERSVTGLMPPSGDGAIQAAGGLLWRDTPSGRQIAVIRRSRYADWTLPKGKLEPGEAWEEAALREVREETGYRARITGFAGVVAYQVDGRVKVVRFWHMLATPEAPAPALDPEVSGVDWLPVEEALRRLQYPLERALLEASGPGGESSPVGR
jgi:8-oxo-dGTP diphosphatase